MGSSRKPWGGRFSEVTDAAVERVSASVHFDRALARYDLRGSIAHATMLGETGVIPAGDARELVRGLEAIRDEIEAGSFPFDPALEDVHMNIEARLAGESRVSAGSPKRVEGVAPRRKPLTRLLGRRADMRRGDQIGQVEKRIVFARLPLKGVDRRDRQAAVRKPLL